MLVREREGFFIILVYLQTFGVIPRYSLRVLFLSCMYQVSLHTNYIGLPMLFELDNYHYLLRVYCR
jgi:hypothetical protein